MEFLKIFATILIVLSGIFFQNVATAPAATTLPPAATTAAAITTDAVMSVQITTAVAAVTTETPKVAVSNTIVAPMTMPVTTVRVNTTVEKTTTIKVPIVVSSAMPSAEPTMPKPKKCGDPSCHMYSKCDKSNTTCNCPITYTVKIDPVCGTDGISYKSIVELEFKACEDEKDVKKDYMGDCTEKKSKKKTIIVIVIVVLLLVLVIIIASVLLIRRKRQAGKANLKEEKAGDALL